MLTVARLKRWGISYYNRTAQDAIDHMKDRQKANGGLGDYYSEKDTRVPQWMVTGDVTAVSDLVGVPVGELQGGVADPEVVARWCDDGMAPNGLMGRKFNDKPDELWDENGKRRKDEHGNDLQPRASVHALDLTVAAPKSVSLMRAMHQDPTTEKIFNAAHNIAMQKQFDYIGKHAGWTRVYNKLTGKVELEHLPGLVGVAYQHETSREGDPHLHTHLIVPMRQARADGKLVTIDTKSLYHEAKAAGMIYQAVLRRELARYGFEWEHVGEHNGMAELAGVTKETIKAYSKRATRLRQWATDQLKVMEDSPTARQLAAAQRATRPQKPESLSWEALKEQWRNDPRGFKLDRAAWDKARTERQAEERKNRRRGGIDRRKLADMAAHIPKADFTRADMVELMAAHWSINGDGDVLEEIENAVDQVALRRTKPREAHNREGNEKYTIDLIVAEEHSIFEMVDREDPRAAITMKDHELEGLGEDQATAISEIARSPQLVQVMQAPAGAGKTHSLKALRQGAHRFNKDVYVLAATGQAVDNAIHDQAADHGYTVAKALGLIEEHELKFTHKSVVLLDEASMVGTADLHKLISALTAANAKLVMVGDQYQLAPVLARGGMFAQLTADLPWAQHLKEVWRFKDDKEKKASLQVRNGKDQKLKDAVHWYRNNDRLAIGDPVAMAEDVYTAYLADRQARKDSLIICDTREMADSLNRRIHTAMRGGAPAVKVARDQSVSVGDLILTRNSDVSIDVELPDGAKADQVRNGNRWTVVGIDTDRGLLHAVRGGNDIESGDGARATFTREYAEKHITLGYATTVHSAQGITVDSCHSLIGQRATRSLAYVAMTRGRWSNKAYMYEKFQGELDHEHTSPTGTDDIHIMRRGSSRSAAAAFYTLLVTNDDWPTTMHAAAAKTEPEQLPARFASLVREHAERVQARKQRYAQWRSVNRGSERGRTRGTIERGHGQGHDDAGIDL